MLRRRSSSDLGSPPAPPGQPSLGGSDAGSREGAGSEIATTDPLVDPDASVGRRRRRRRAPSNVGLDPGSPQPQKKNEPNAGDRLVNAIKTAMKTNQSDISWNSRKGPERGVRFRGGTPPSPPLWKGSSADLRALARWEKKVQVWMLQMKSYATDEDTALAIFTSLSGEAELEVEHLDLSLVHAKTGVQYVLDALREPCNKSSCSKRDAFSMFFESVARNNGESIRGYINRYNRVVRDLEAIGNTTTGMYDSESRGYRLLERSRLAPDLQRLVLIAAGNSLQYCSMRRSQTPCCCSFQILSNHLQCSIMAVVHQRPCTIGIRKALPKVAAHRIHCQPLLLRAHSLLLVSLPLRGNTLDNIQKGSFKLNRLEVNSCQQFQSRLMPNIWINKMQMNFKMLMRAKTTPRTMKNLMMMHRMIWMKRP